MIKNQTSAKKKSKWLYLPICSWCIFLFMIYIQHPIWKCFLLIILLFQNH